MRESASERVRETERESECESESEREGGREGGRRLWEAGADGLDARPLPINLAAKRLFLCWPCFGLLSFSFDLVGGV